MKTCTCKSEMILVGTASTNGQYWTCRACGSIEPVIQKMELK
jgi:hypothetical protein